MNENRRKLYILIANSIIIYVLAYLVILIPSQILTAFVASFFDIPSKYHFFKIIFPIVDHSYLWNKTSVPVIYLVTPVFVILTAIIVYRSFVLYFRRHRINFNLFFVWIYAHCTNLFFGGLIIGIPLVKGFGYVPNWMRSSDEFGYVLIVISILLLLANGLVLRRLFTSLYYDIPYLNSPFHSLVFKIGVIFLPFFIGNLVFFIFRIPDNSIYERLVGITMIVQLVATLPFTSVYYPEEEQSKPVRFSFRAIISLAVLLLAFMIWKLIFNQYFYKIL